jgi:hypothetical protein
MKRHCSLAIKARERKATKKKYSRERDRTEGGRTEEEKKLSFLCFFSKKQRRPRRETTSSGGRKQPVLHHVSISLLLERK